MSTFCAKRWAWTVAMVACAGAALAGACSSSARVMGVRGEDARAAVPRARPADFTLAATVLSRGSVEAKKLPRSLRPGRYIVEADGVLRAATGPGATTTTFPGRTRQLTAEQFDSLWRDVRESGLLDPGNPARVDGPEAVGRVPERTTALLYAAYEGKRVTLRVPLDRSSEDAIAAERVVDRLAGLAWMR